MVADFVRDYQKAVLSFTMKVRKMEKDSEIKKGLSTWDMVNDAVKAAQATCNLFGLSSDNIQYIDLSNQASPVK